MDKEEREESYSVTRIGQKAKGKKPGVVWAIRLVYHAPQLRGFFVI